MLLSATIYKDQCIRYVLLTSHRSYRFQNQQFNDVLKVLYLLKSCFVVNVKLLKGVCEGSDLDFQQFSIVVNVFRADSLMNDFLFLPKDSVHCSK